MYRIVMAVAIFETAHTALAMHALYYFTIQISSNSSEQLMIVWFVPF